jgi:hypothetical protein
MVECLTCECEALRSKPSATQKKKIFVKVFHVVQNCLVSQTEAIPLEKMRHHGRSDEAGGRGNGRSSPVVCVFSRAFPWSSSNVIPLWQQVQKH